MTTLSQEQFKELQTKVGGLPLTEAERASLIQTLDKEIEELQNTIQSKIPKDMADEITNLATIQAEQIAESAAKILTTKMQARVPASILGTVDVPADFGGLSETINLKADEIFDDVGKFHDQFSKKNIPGANECLTDILETGESAEIKLAFSEIKNLFGSDKKYMKEIKGQIDAFVAVNKLFSKQYKRLDGKTTLDSYYVARELAQDFLAQEKKVETKKFNTFFEGRYEIGFSYVVDEDMLTRYDDIIGELENAAGVEDNIIRDYYLVEETGLTPKSIENYDFSERASAVARDFFKTVTQADFDAMSTDEIREAIKGIAIRHARSTFQSYKSRGLTAAGKVSDILIENTKAAAEFVVAGGQVAAEMGIEAGKAALEARRERIEEERELSEFAASLKPEDFGIPAASMRGDNEDILGIKKRLLKEGAAITAAKSMEDSLKRDLKSYHQNRLDAILLEQAALMPDSVDTKYFGDEEEIRTKEAKRLQKEKEQIYADAAADGIVLDNPRTITKPKTQHQRRLRSQLKCPRCGTPMDTEKARRRGCPNCIIKSSEQRQQDAKEFEAYLEEQRLAAQQTNEGGRVRRYNPGVSWYD